MLLSPSFDTDTTWIPPTSDDFACWEVWVFTGNADFQGVVCEWCLPGFGHDDGYSFAKYSQIKNSETKSRVCGRYGQSSSLVCLTKSSLFDERCSENMRVPSGRTREGLLLYVVR